MTLDHEDLIKLLSKFQGHVLVMKKDPNGNYVIQRFIHTISDHAKSAKVQENHELGCNLMDRLQFIIDDVIEHSGFLSTHSYGCRVVQRTLEFCIKDCKSDVLKAILSCKSKLVSDKYGMSCSRQ